MGVSCAGQRFFWREHAYLYNCDCRNTVIPVLPVINKCHVTRNSRRLAHHWPQGGGGEGVASWQGWTRKSHDMDTQALSICTQRVGGAWLAWDTHRCYRFRSWRHAYDTAQCACAQALCCLSSRLGKSMFLNYEVPSGVQLYWKYVNSKNC